MPFGVNPLTGRPGPAPKQPREGDKAQAQPRPAVEIVGPMGSREWRWFDSYGIGPKSMLRKSEVRP